jgi:hypothetical protein
MSAITEKDIQLMAEIKEDPKAYDLLRAKCRWEHMTLYAVLKGWGDPREWSDYKEESGD